MCNIESTVSQSNFSANVISDNYYLCSFKSFRFLINLWIRRTMNDEHRLDNLLIRNSSGDFVSENHSRRRSFASERCGYTNTARIENYGRAYVSYILHDQSRITAIDRGGRRGNSGGPRSTSSRGRRYMHKDVASCRRGGIDGKVPLRYAAISNMHLICYIANNRRLLYHSRKTGESHFPSVNIDPDVIDQDRTNLSVLFYPRIISVRIINE